jgi:hypothetical protein
VDRVVEERHPASSGFPCGRIAQPSPKIADAGLTLARRHS